MDFGAVFDNNTESLDQHRSFEASSTRVTEDAHRDTQEVLPPLLLESCAATETHGRKQSVLR